MHLIYLIRLLSPCLYNSTFACIYSIYISSYLVNSKFHLVQSIGISPYSSNSKFHLLTWITWMLQDKMASKKKRGRIIYSSDEDEAMSNPPSCEVLTVYFSSVQVDNWEKEYWFCGHYRVSNPIFCDQLVKWPRTNISQLLYRFFLWAVKSPIFMILAISRIKLFHCFT